LQHLEKLLLLLSENKSHINNWDAVLYALYYHDIVYDASAFDNEKRSAEMAIANMHQLGIPTELINLCESHILATKHHLISADSDTNYFTDADLSILGQPWYLYDDYAQKVRQEYAIYPDEIYKPGRIKVLEHFLKLDAVFKVPVFQDRFEKQARLNMQRELEIWVSKS
jgi:predicted metal-dependent HD superfamily phosphohydrolase